MKKRTLLFLLVANGILLAVSWIMAFYSYPRLPQEIPLWINFFKQETILTKKSLFFFVYPLVQTLFCLCFGWLSRINFSRELLPLRKKYSFHKKEYLILNLRKEFIYLALIFFNLIFIHLQRSIILIAHNIEEGVDKFYFPSLFGIIILLIPYFRMRMRLLLKNLDN